MPVRRTVLNCKNLVADVNSRLVIMVRSVKKTTGNTRLILSITWRVDTVLSCVLSSHLVGLRLPVIGWKTILQP